MYVGLVKTLTTREFYHSPGILKSVRPGQSLLVTDHGEPAFTVTKAGSRPRRTAEQLLRRSREVIRGDRPVTDYTAILKAMKR